MKQSFVYIISNRKNGTIYTGVTSDLNKRIFQHKNKLIDGFSKKYGLDKLVFFEEYADIYNAIVREKEIKGWLRRKKIELIESINPNWNDLAESWFNE